MANALDAAMFSVKEGNTGVGSKKTTLEAIDKGALAVKSWKDGIDADRLKLKTDTADRYREAEKLAQEKIGAMQPNNKTERDLVIKGLASYKDQLYNNMQLVKNGVIKPDENTIFQSNGKQTFDIISQQIAGQAEQTNLSLERAKGGYWPDEEGGPDVFHDPIAGGYEAKLQEIQNAVSNPQFTNINFGRDGMGQIEFYKTKLNTATNTMELDLDADGEPQRNENFGISILALNKNANQRSDAFYLNKEVNALVKDGPLGNTFEIMGNSGKMYNSILDYQMENPLVEELIIDASAVATSTSERVASILIDNGTQAERSIPTTPSEWASLTDEQKSETISYEYTDSKGKRHTDGIKYKYMEMRVSSNNTIVPVFREGNEDVRGDKEVARDMATSSIIGAIEKDYTDKGSKRSEFQKQKFQFDNDKQDDEDQGTVDLIDQAATGNKNSLDALVAENSDVVSAYNITGTEGNLILEFIDMDGNKLAPIPLSGLGKDAGKQIAAQLRLKAQIYSDKSTLDQEAAKGIESSYQTVTKEYKGLGNLDLGVTEVGGIKRPGTAAESFAAAIENDPDEDEVTGVANTIIQKAIKEYSLDMTVDVSFKEESGYKDRYVITLDGVDYESPRASSAENHVWLQENMDRVLRGEKPLGEVDGEETPNLG
jgi:hypothetical protein